MRLLLLASVLLAACGGAYGNVGAGRASASPVGSPVMATLTTADNGATVTVHVGDRMQVALGEQYDWKLDPPDGVVLTHPVQNYMLIRGTQAIWLASAAGTTTIRATGTPVCPSGAPCAQFAILFTATVNVIP